MTTKKEIKDRFQWQPPVLDEKGREVVSPVSLVSVADLRPVTMAERVRRYMRLPQFVEDQKTLHDLWAEGELDENLDPDAVPLSQYEDRAREVAARVQVRKAKEAKEASEAKAEQDRRDFEAWSKKYEELRQKAASPPPGSSPGQTDSPPAES